MLRLILTSVLILLFTACTHDSVIIDTPKISKALSSDTIANIPIPVREQGYSNFKTQVIKTQTELDNFVESVDQQESWNEKKNFLETLLLKKIDFSYYNLLLYRITESSGSTVLSVDAPTGNAENITIIIGRDEPSMKTSDMAHYALAYKVAKSVTNITFDNGLKKNVIENKTITSKVSTIPTPVPDKCLEWFDGCNNCGRVSDKGIPVCTEKHCESYEEFKCTKWKENAEQQKLESDPSHHDSEQSLPRSQQTSDE
ncbi:hypothetical protein KKC13_02645 [bacterium]|nr:hypothetical protein [bacterium]MBU1957142.1 hypothetical protein [bacterium]